MPTRELVTESNSPDRSGFSRRDLLGNAALIGAGFAVGPLWFAACADQSKDINNRIDRRPDRGASDMKTRKLGTLEVSELVLPAPSRSGRTDRRRGWCGQGSHHTRQGPAL